MMDGVHDLGGREGFGPIRDKEDDAPFHADWEARAFGAKQAAASGKGWSIDWFRHSRETIEPVDYLTRPYFDQWITALAAEMVDEGYLTFDEVRTGTPRFRVEPDVPPATADSARASISNPKSYAMAAGSPPRFAAGDAVSCRLTGSPGHTRMPGYVRGRKGVVHAAHGGHILPDASTQGEERGEHLYTVAFAAGELWPEAAESPDAVFVDLWESYLEPC